MANDKREMLHMKTKRFNEKHKVNQTSMICYAVLVFILFAAYMLELVKGNRTPGYIVVFDILLIVPFVISLLTYIKNRESSVLKYIITAGYGVMYIFVILTSVTKLSFVYIVPMIIILTLYRDWKVVLATGAASIAANIIFVFYYLDRISNTATDITEFEIQVIVLILITAYAVAATRILIRVNNQAIADISEREEKQHDDYERIVDISRKVSANVEKINALSEDVRNRTEMTKSSVNDIASGTLETAQSIQSQMEMTGNIQTLIDDMTGLSESVLAECNTSKQNISDGMDSMDELTDNSNRLNDSSARVIESMKNLQEKAEQVNGIITMISDIAEQTSLLSLNASIEAARAGEAGKGFAVVADEIKKLSEQTGDATAQISRIILELEQETDSTGSNVSDMNSVIEKQIECISMVSDKFRTLGSSIDTLAGSIDEQTHKTDEVRSANGQIMHSIEGLSAFSEELTANSESTKAQSEESYQGTLQINSILGEIAADISRLNG